MVDDCEFGALDGYDVECGWVEVPADRSEAGGDMIRLHVAIVKSSDNPDRKPDPVVYLEGGPGGDALEALPLVFEDSYSHLLADRDVIFFDQRGTGYSEPSLACPELRELGFELIEDDLPTDELLELEIDALEECRDRLLGEGAQLDDHSSADSAADLYDIRRALGYEEWNLYGISYGTRLAMTTARDYPEGIRSVILDSTYPASADIISETPANLDRALGTLFAGCAADAECNSAYPDLETVFYDTVDELERDPIRAPVTDVLTGDVYNGAVFDGSAFGSIVFQSLYSAEVIPSLPRIINNVATGEYYELSLLASSFIANGEYVSIGMQLSVQCQEEVPFSSPEAISAALADYPRLQPVLEGALNLGPPVFEVCDLWGAGAADPIENEAISFDIPTLVLAGEYDPITPPSWSQAAAETLSASTVIEFPGAGHGPSASLECPQMILREFLNDPSAPVDDSCVDDMGPPEFLTPNSPLPEVTLVPFSQAYGPVTLEGIAPEEWEEISQGVFARQLDGLDQTVMIQQFGAGLTSQMLLNLLTSQFGLESAPDPADSYSTALGSWSLFELTVTGVPGVIALIDTPEGAGLVVLLGAPNEFDTLEADVLFPVLDAFSLS